MIPRSTNRPIRSATFRADEGNSENIRLDILLRNQAAILGCTEIGLLISPADSNLPVHDSTKIHAVAAVELALA